MSIETKQIEWTSQAGKAVVVTVTSTKILRERVINADGDVIHTGKVELIESTCLAAKVDGQIVGESYCLSPAPEGAPAGIAAVIGRLGMTQANKARIETAIQETSTQATTPEIAEYLSARSAALAQSAELDRRYRAYNRMVRLQEGE